MIEAGALVLLGTAGGMLIALWTTPTVGRLALEQFGGADRAIAVSWRAIAVVLDPGADLCRPVRGAAGDARGAARRQRDAARGTPPRERALRRLFVIGEVALAFVLLVSMSLLGRHLLSVLDVKPGFTVDDVVALSLSLPSARYADGRVVSFYSSLQTALEERLGRGTISIVDELPLSHDRGRSVVSAGARRSGPEAVVRTVAPGYFDVMGIPVAAGRTFDRNDGGAAPLRVVVSRSLAERVFGTGQPVGRQLFLGLPAQPPRNRRRRRRREAACARGCDAAHRLPVGAAGPFRTPPCSW